MTSEGAARRGADSSGRRLGYTTIAAGLRVDVVHPHPRSAVHGNLLKLDGRNPRRRPPPEIVDDLPQPLEPEGRRAPIVIDPVPTRFQHRAIWTLGQLVRFLFTRLRLKLLGRLDDETEAVMTRRLFERLSGMWIKVGQLLSLRTDLMSEAMCRELASLQYQMRGFSPEVARRVIEEELQKPISSAFAYFEPTPFAAASIAQVHRATLLRNNRAVVVKVMRPDVERTFARDLRLLSWIVRLFKTFGLFHRFRLDEGMRELHAIFGEEVDYQHEAVNLLRMRKSLHAHGIYVPRLVKSLSRRRILVIEEVSGVLMSDYIRLRREDPDCVHRWSVLNGIDRETVARRLIVTVLRQILEDNEFHGDLHPGNIMLLADNRIALIDFGSVSRLRRHVWLLYQQSLSALATHDYERAADYMLMMSPARSPAANRRARRELADVLQQWQLRAQMPSSTYEDRSIAAMARGTAKIMADNHMPLNWGLMRVGRTFSTLDASLMTLVPEANFMTMARAYFHDRMRRQRTPRGRIETWRLLKQQTSAVLGDIHILVGGGIREQALRLHGMLDRGAYLRLTMLNYTARGVWFLVFLTGLGFLLDEGVDVHDGHNVYSLQHILESVPDLDFLQWVVLLVVGLWLTRLARAARTAVE